MKILNWNINSGGAERCDQIVDCIISHDADIVVLTEFRAKYEERFRESLRQGAYSSFLTSNPGKNENGILIASRTKLVKNTGVPLAMDGQRWLEAVLPDLELNILAVHIPGSGDNRFHEEPRMGGKERKQIFWEKLVEYSEVELLSKRTMIIGDFNTGLKVDAQGVPFSHSKYMIRLLQMGFVDAWRYLNQDAREFTWYSHQRIDGISKDKNGFRLDYIFLSPCILSNLDCAIHSHDERIKRISDHSAIVGEFTF